MIPLGEYLTTRGDRCPHGYAINQTDHACKPATDTGSIRPEEWAAFVSAIRQATDDQGLVSQTRVRPLLRGRIYHKHIGACYTRARRMGLLVQVGKEDSTDAAGRNTDKDQRLYRLGKAA